MPPDIDSVAGDSPESGGELALTVVRYTDRPDRCTVYPPDASGDIRMSTWLTVDRTACVDLDTVR